MQTGLVYDDRYTRHLTGSHPERPGRLTAIIERLHGSPLWGKLKPIEARAAEVEQVRAVHRVEYLSRLERACEEGEQYIDTPDSAICPGSFEVAMLAAGGVLAAVDAVMAGVVVNAFCAVRPPGHHAEADRSMGFCLLNNVAIAAEHLVREHKLVRVAIVDFDVHHGNGTQHLFEARSDVLFISLHGDPTSLYPGTGFAWEKGTGAGEGFTLNIPMEPGSGDGDYQRAFVEQVVPKLDVFGPEFMLVSAGFDAAMDDPLGNMRVSGDGFAWMTRELKSVAERHCGGRLVSTLEGGYNLERLAEGVYRHVGVLMEEKEEVSGRWERV